MLRSPFRTVVLLVSTVALLCPTSGFAQEEGKPSIFELARQQEGEPVWAPLLRLRDAEERFEGNRRKWAAYAQMRAQKEALLGRHEAALRLWDSWRPAAGNSVASLPSGTKAVGAVARIAAMADTARVVMINERHHAAADRLLTLRLLPFLYQQGYRYLAAEALSPSDSTLLQTGVPITDATGTYTDEVVYGTLLRVAHRLGYTIVPYALTQSQREMETDLSRRETRDSLQAWNLYDHTLGSDPDAKVLVHAGFAHVKESVTKDWHPMAAYFRSMSGVDPLTVDQTTLSERSDPSHEHPVYRGALRDSLLRGRPVVLTDASGAPLTLAGFGTDLEVLTPRTRYVADRPHWMSTLPGRIATDVSVPACRERRCIVEVRRPGDPPNAVPLDRTEVVEAGTVRLFVPSHTPVRIRIRSIEGAVLREDRYTVPSSPSSE